MLFGSYLLHIGKFWPLICVLAMLLFALRDLLRKGNDKLKNLHVDDSSQPTDWQRYIVFWIIRRKRNNHDFMIYLTKCVNVSLLLRLKRIALQWNWTPCTFLFIHNVYLWNKIINCTVTFIRLQYTLQYYTLHEATQSAVKSILSWQGGGEVRRD
jgi:hypothetical protein